MSETILILGGTKEAAELAANLVRDRPDARIITSLAGRTKDPEPVAGEIRKGGFGGAEGLVRYVRDTGVTRLIDATHPFAKQISENARVAAATAGVPLEIRTRAPWPREPGDIWIEVASLVEARDAIPAGARVLLALGSQHLDTFARRADVHFVVRMVDPPAASLALPSHEIILGKPGRTPIDEATLLKRYRLSHIVCRNSGGDGAYAKIAAARDLGLPVIMIRR